MGIAVAIGLESTSRLRLLGIMVACTGCLLYSVLDATDGRSHVSMASALEGNFSFFLQGFGCSFLYINQKPLFKRYSPLVILGYAYVVATVVMGKQAPGRVHRHRLHRRAARVNHDNFLHRHSFHGATALPPGGPERERLGISRHLHWSGAL